MRLRAFGLGIFLAGAAASAPAGAALSQPILRGSAGPRTFGGNECADDCSSHAAGYAWAEQGRNTTLADCDLHAEAFAEGCRTYFADPTRGAEQDDDGAIIEGQAQDGPGVSGMNDPADASEAE